MLLDVDDDALARAAAVLGTTSEVETVNHALRMVAGAAEDTRRRRFDELVALVGDRLDEADVRSEAWR
jgi:Arc/MetJ family transcription regulator